MSSETTMAAEQCRLREWGAQIRDCQDCPDGMSIVNWCACHSITKANYYRLRRVREARLETIQREITAQQIVPVQLGLLQQQEQKDDNEQLRLDISIKGDSIHVTESPPMPLLAAVIEVMRNAYDAACFKAVYIVCGYKDLRSGMDWLAALIETRTGNRPYAPDMLYLFCGRCTDRIKGQIRKNCRFLLYWNQ